MLRYCCSDAEHRRSLSWGKGCFKTNWFCWWSCDLIHDPVLCLHTPWHTGTEPVLYTHGYIHTHAPSFVIYTFIYIYMVCMVLSLSVSMETAREIGTEGASEGWGRERVKEILCVCVWVCLCMCGTTVKWFEFTWHKHPCSHIHTLTHSHAHSP